MKKLLLILLCLGIVIPCFAQDTTKEDQQIIVLSNRLDEISDLLQKTTDDKRKAELLYEKAYITLTTFGVTGLRTGTECLLKAIELAPDKDEYKQFLGEAYDALWKDRDFSYTEDEDEDSKQIAKDLGELQEKVGIKVEEYKK